MPCTKAHGFIYAACNNENMKILIYLTILTGLLGVLLKRSLLLKIMAMDVMSTGVISYFVVAAARKGTLTPTIISMPLSSYADPVPQAVILTAIVIGEK